jgi:HEAT repeat protein/uncharacterized protein YegL
VAVGSTSERSLEQCVAEFHKRVAIQTARASQVKALLDIARVHTDAATDALLKIHSSCHASLKENVLYALSLCQAPSAHEALLKFAKGKDRDNRLQAARSLLLRKREDQLWLRDKRLKSERDPEIRGFLLRALLDADIPDLDRICLRDAKSKHTAIAIAGVYGIGKLRLEKGIKIVKKHLSQAKPRLRAASFQALASLGGKDSFLLLIEALGNPRNTAEFPQIIGALCAADESEELNVLIRTGLRAKDEWVVSGAIQGIAAAAAHLPEICGPALLGMLTHKSAEIRTAAIEGLVAARPAGAIEALGRRLRHPDQKTRTDALWALAKIGNLPSNIMGKIVALTTDKSIAMRIQSTLAMQWFNDDSALKAAIARLQDESWAVRSAAAEALLEIRRLESVLPLLNAFTAESGRVADELYETLCQLTGEDFGPALGAWRNWYSDQKLGYALPAADVSAERLKTRRERRAKSGGSTASYHGIPIPRGGVVFILDSSGSMNNSYSAKQTYYEYFSSLLSETIQHLPGSTRFNVIFFESGVRVWQENLQEATKVNIALAREFLSDNLPGGGTNIYDSLMAALNMDGVQTIFFMTDGDPTAGRYQTRNEIFSRFRRANRDKRIVLNTIAAGKVSAEFLASLAASNGGKSVDLTDLAKKTKAKEDQP